MLERRTLEMNFYFKINRDEMESINSTRNMWSNQVRSHSITTSNSTDIQTSDSKQTSSFDLCTSLMVPLSVCVRVKN